MKLGYDTSLEKDIHVRDDGVVVVLGRNDDFIRSVVLDTPECLFIDTRGIEILPYIAREKVKDTIYLKASDTEHPFSFNPLNIHNTTKHDTSLEVLHTFRTLNHSSWGPQLEMILTASLRAVLDNPQPTFLKMYQLLTTQPYRSTLHHDDHFIKQFWRSFDAWEDKEQFQRTQSTLNKLFAFLHHPTTRNILCQTNKLTFAGKTVIVNLSGIPRDLQRLLGSLLAPYSKRVVVTDASLFAVPERTAMTLEYARYPKRDWDALVVFKARGLDRDDVAKELNILPNELAKLDGAAWVMVSQNALMHASILEKGHDYSQLIVEQSRRKYTSEVRKVDTDLSMFLENRSGRARAYKRNVKRTRKFA